MTMAKTGTLTSRMEMRVDDSFIATVTELANLTQQSKAEVLRDALNLYYKAVKEYEENGKGIVFQVIEQSQGSSKTTAAVTATGRLLRKLPGVPRVHKVIAVKPDGAVRTVLKREHT